MQIKRLDHHLFRKLFKRWFVREYIKKMEEGSADTGKHAAFNSRPVIVLGMHRSGTSLLIKTMEKIGVFTGDITGPDTSEALFFQYINDAVLACSQAHWSNPEPLELVEKNKDWCNAIVSVVNLALTSRWRYLYRFFSPDAFIQEDKTVWGWKDPRNCLTINFWLRLFPDARFVYIYRHGMDVAESLFRRERKAGDSVYIARCLNLESSFHMWETYNRMVLHGLDSVAKENQLHICFEEMAENPAPVLKQLAGFCDLDISDKLISQLSAEVDIDKAYAHKSHQNTFGLSVSERSSLMESETLKKLGYS